MWPPFRGAGIRIDELSADYLRCSVSLKFRWWNKNANRTQYGGSMFSMTDPIYPLMFMGILGKEYVVWDKAAEIEYIAPGKERLLAEFELSPQQIADIRDATKTGRKIFPQFDVLIKDANGTEVAKIKRTLYIRKKEKYCLSETAVA
ncbi:DUF4442 domain-containing protein [Moritella viscosa]